MGGQVAQKLPFSLFVTPASRGFSPDISVSSVKPHQMCCFGRLSSKPGFKPGKIIETKGQMALHAGLLGRGKSIKILWEIKWKSYSYRSKFEPVIVLVLRRNLTLTSAT